MEIVHEGRGRPELLEGSVVTIGFFDGVHLGHQALLADLRQLAAELRCPAVVATFDRHPASVVRPESAPRLLTDFTQRTELFAGAGVDVTYVIHFDEERSLQPPEQFAREVMADGLRARVVLVGQDFHYGRRRRGDVASLAELGAVQGFKVVGRARLESDELGESVSTTAIREALAGG